MLSNIALLIRNTLGSSRRPVHNLVCFSCLARGFHTSLHCNASGIADSKKGDRKYDREIPLFTWDNLRRGFPLFKNEVKMFRDELKEKFAGDPDIYRVDDQVDIQFDFRGPEFLNKWVASCDQDFNEGFSTAQLSVTNAGLACFSGVLNTQVPKDGIIKSAGFANMRSVPLRKSFQRDDRYMWAGYTHLVLRVRGDGRTYLINMHTPGSYDITCMDMFTYIMPTRGGPYWQDVRIPFSKFFFAARGRSQDFQLPLDVTSVSSLSITLADNIDGPFRLDLDYIGVLFDANHSEQFAYEHYNQPMYVAGN